MDSVHGVMHCQWCLYKEATDASQPTQATQNYPKTEQLSIFFTSRLLPSGGSVYGTIEHLLSGDCQCPGSRGGGR